MSPPDHLRRRLVLTSLALPGLQACAPLLPPLATGASPEAADLLAASARAHGLDAFSNFADLSVSYTGRWRGLVDRLQPALVDAGFRGSSQERLLLREGVVAQAHTGPRGRKYVLRWSAAEAAPTVRVWFNGTEVHDQERLAAAALVVDGYELFLLGPMWLAGARRAGRTLALEYIGGEQIRVAGIVHSCEVLRVELTPGLGFATADRLSLYIDRQARLMRRVRFSLEGLDSTRGAVAEVDLYDHVTAHDVVWPTGFYERLLRPLPLPVHRWRLTGLDVNRGLTRADVDGGAFRGNAEPPAGAFG
jgi:hypothetical protein